MEKPPSMGALSFPESLRKNKPHDCAKRRHNPKEAPVKQLKKEEHRAVDSRMWLVILASGERSMNTRNKGCPSGLFCQLSVMK